MANQLENTQLIKYDVLDRADESRTASAYVDRVLTYINRTYRTLCAGASEFLPEYVEDWWWMRSEGILTLVPAIETTATVTQDSASVTLGAAPAISVAGYKFRMNDHPEVFNVSAHTAATTAVTLDSAYTGESGAGPCRLMKTEYSLSSAVNSLMSPMVGFRGNDQIVGISPERMDDQYPLSSLSTGIPWAFSLEDRQSVRFSHGGRTDGQSMRVEYRYRKIVDDLTDSTSSIPLVPLEWRHLLSDMALTYVLLEKNDDRSNAVALSARTGLAAMLKENRRLLSKMGGKYTGRIMPRQAGLMMNDKVLRTESGLIIGN